MLCTVVGNKTCMWKTSAHNMCNIWFITLNSKCMFRTDSVFICIMWYCMYVHCVYMVVLWADTPLRILGVCILYSAKVYSHWVIEDFICFPFLCNFHIFSSPLSLAFTWIYFSCPEARDSQNYFMNLCCVIIWKTVIWAPLAVKACTNNCTWIRICVSCVY